jgi:hypothetical protein
MKHRMALNVTITKVVGRQANAGRERKTFITISLFISLYAQLEGAEGVDG